MDLELANKNAIVCASSSGIGKAIAMSLGSEGVNVSIFSSNKEKISLAAKEISANAEGKVIFNKCDLEKKDEIESVFKKTVDNFGTVDILVNNQPGPALGNFVDVSQKQLEYAFSINISSVFHITKLCLPLMKRQNWGRIVNILSVSAKESSSDMMFLTNVLRPAMLGFSKTLAKEYAQYNITINSILPSSVKTPRLEHILDRKAKEKAVDFESFLREFEDALPPKRLASPEELASVVTFVCSPKASYLNGAAIPVDCAYTNSIF